MKTLYIECNMGAAGDMLMAALTELHPNPDDFIKRLNALNIPNVVIEKEKTKKCGITGTHIRVRVNGTEESEEIHHHHDHEHHHHEQHHNHGHEHHHHHVHRSLGDIKHIIGHLNLDEKVYNDVMAVYTLIAEAESAAHDCDIENIHFHEVGTMDAIADITGVCMLFNELGADRIIASPVNTGRGQVKCAHGILPVPAPATAHILKNVPVYSNNIEGELCTPTGAAILKHFADEFSSMPVMQVEKTGYGMGTKDFETANCVRVFMGETNKDSERVAELICNIDDMTGEAVAFAVNRLFAAGAREVFTTSVGMKKNRPGILLTCICSEDKREEMLRIIFKHTSTIGVRENISARYTLKREQKTVDTKYGTVRVKESRGYGVVKTKAEYDDLEKIAIENDISISDIKF